MFTFKRLSLPIIEIAFGAYMSSCIYISVRYDWALASIPFLLIFAGGYLYVGFDSVYALYQMHRESSAAAEEELPVASA